jgi:hypothetical protein
MKRIARLAAIALAPGMAGRVRLAALALTGLALFVNGAYCLRNLGSTSFDDAFMFARYARHWLDGNGFSWNIPDGPAYGITSALYLFVVTALRGLTSLSDAHLLTGLSYGFGLLSVAVLVRLAFQVVRNETLRTAWVPLLVVPCVLMNSAFASMQITGMETTLAVLLNAVLACAAVAWSRSPSTGRLVLCLAAAYAAILTRPDSGLYALGIPPLLLLASDRAAWKKAAVYVCAFLGVLAADLWLKRALFGNFLPLPFHAKASGFYDGYLGVTLFNSVSELVAFLRQMLPFLLLMACAGVRGVKGRLGAVLLPVAATFVYFLSVVMIMGMDSRYFFPALPFFVLAAALALDARMSRSPEDFRAAFPGMLAVGAAIIACTSPPAQRVAASAWAHGVVGKPAHYQPSARFAVPANGSLPPLDWWANIGTVTALIERLPRDIVIAASEHGLLGSRLPDVTIIDLVGLHDRHHAHEGFSADAVFARKPDLVWFPHGDYTRIVKDLVDHPRFLADYEYYPKAYLYGIAIRRDSRHHAALRQALEVDFARTYGGLKLSDYRAYPIGSNP